MESANLCKLFVANLGTTSDDEFRRFYQKWGAVKNSFIVPDPITKKSRGYGFLTYTNQSEVDNAMKNRPHIINGHLVDPKRALPRDMYNPDANVNTNRLHVKFAKPIFINKKHTEDLLKKYFTDFGNVVKVEIVYENEMPGHVIVEFDDYDSVDKCTLWGQHYFRGIKLLLAKVVNEVDQSRPSKDGQKRATKPPISMDPQVPKVSSSMDSQMRKILVNELRNSIQSRFGSSNQEHALECRTLSVSSRVSSGSTNPTSLVTDFRKSINSYFFGDPTNLKASTGRRASATSATLRMDNNRIFDRQTYPIVKYTDKFIRIVAIRVLDIVLDEDGEQKPTYQVLILCDDGHVAKILAEDLWDKEPKMLGQVFEKLCSLKQVGEEFQFES